MRRTEGVSELPGELHHALLAIFCTRVDMDVLANVGMGVVLDGGGVVDAEETFSVIKGYRSELAATRCDELQVTVVPCVRALARGEGPATYERKTVNGEATTRGLRAEIGGLQSSVSIRRLFSEDSAHQDLVILDWSRRMLAD